MILKAQFIPAWIGGKAQLKAQWSNADAYRLTASVRRLTRCQSGVTRQTILHTEVTHGL